MLKAIRPGDHLIVTAPHRLFRNLLAAEAQMEEWRRIGISLHFADMNVRTDTPAGRLMVQIFGAIAEWQSRIKGQRQREANAWRKARAAGQEVEKIPRAEIPPSKVRSKVTVGHVYAGILQDRRRKREEPFSGTIRAYIRVSTDDQTAETQRHAITQFLSQSPEYNGAAVHWYDDTGYSAYSLDLKKRPDGKRLMADLQPGDLVVALRADRVSRSIKGILGLANDIQEKRAAMYLLDCGMKTDTPSGEVMLALLGFVGQAESADNDAGQSAAKQHQAMTQGMHISEMPFWLMSRETYLSYPHRYGTRWREAMPDEEFTAMIKEFYRMIKSGESRFVLQMDPNKTEHVGYKRAARLVSKEWCKRLGWPIPVCKMQWRSKEKVFKRFQTTVAEAIAEAEKMQAELGETESRRELIRILRTAKGKRYTGPIPQDWSKELYHSIEEWSSKAAELVGTATHSGVRSEEGVPAELKRLAEIAAI